MAESHGKGDKWANPHDGVGRAGQRVIPPDAPPESRGHIGGQQSGSKRPAVKTGAAKKAPKKGEKGD
jgi:hypothetical protein